MAAILAAGCGDDDDGADGTSGTAEPTAAASPTGLAGLPKPTIGPVSPPMEGPPRPAAATTRTNYRELPNFSLPSPEDLPEPPDDADSAEFHPPADPQCPDGWEILRRPLEGFEICHPQDWVIDGHGYVTAGVEDRWYSVGFFLRRDGANVAHVSVYAVNPFAMPFTYTRHCEKAYRVSFAGQPAALCPDYPGVLPEAKIIAYHLRREEFDYFVNVVPRYTYDFEAGRYIDEWDKEAEATAIQIAQTFKLTPIVSPI